MKRIILEITTTTFSKIYICYNYFFFKNKNGLIQDLLIFQLSLFSSKSSDLLDLFFSFLQTINLIIPIIINAKQNSKIVKK